MDRIPCDPLTVGTPECFVFQSEGRCYEDIHHPQRQSNAETCLERTWQLELGKVATCRAFHRWLEREEDASVGSPPFPPVEVMRDQLIEAGVFISKNKRQRIWNGSTA